MKHILLITIAAVLLLGCGPSEAERALFDAVINGDIEAVKQHLTAGTDVNQKDKFRLTPLHYTGAYGHKEIAELLISKGADVNAKGKNGWTPLHYAARNGHKEVVELLIAEGADVNAKDYGSTSLFDAANAKDDDGSTPLHFAAEGDRKEIAELLIAKGADVNAKDNYGKTPLDLAEEVSEDDLPEDKAAKKETADLLRKHGGKTGEELKAEGK
jgi:ankyrin repeat protein